MKLGGLQVHLGLFAVAALTLPVGLARLAPPAPGNEVWWVPLLLATSIGPVFFAVSAQAPLMQRWYAAHPAAGQPWALYAASNLGSFGGLIAYPLLAEPLLPLRQQAWLWSGGYVLLAVLIALCARARWDSAEPPGNMIPQAAETSAIPHSRLRLWVLLAAVPSGLMLSTTTHLTTDIFAMPLLLAASIGPVFFAVSAQAPLMQRWYAAHPAAGQPWALYAASNLGSFGGLIAYPLLVEPWLALRQQAWLWSAGYLLLLILIGLCARARCAKLTVL